MVFARGPNPSTRDLFEAQRANIGDLWSAPVERTELTTADVDGGPTLALGGRLLVYFTIRSGGTGGTDLYTATRDAPMQPFTNLTELTELNTVDDDQDPWISEDGRVLVFSRNGDLYMAVR